MFELENDKSVAIVKQMHVHINNKINEPEDAQNFNEAKFDS